MTDMDHITLDAQARAILRANDRGGYTVPTAGLYPYQWNWDSAFAGLGFAACDVDRAWAELNTLLAGQWPTGMIPHILFHAPDPGYFPGPDVWGTEGKGPIASSGITQPPVAMTLLRSLHDRDPARPDLAPAYDALLTWLGWFMDWRCAEGVIFVTHPWESGRDNAPDWDSAMAAIAPAGVAPYTRRDTQHVDASMRPTKDDYDRYIWLVERGRRLGWDEAAMAQDAPFRTADPGMTFIVMGAARDLARVGRALGRDVSRIESWLETLNAGAAGLWNDEIGGYDARNLNTGGFEGALSNASYLCWFAGLDSAPALAGLRRCLDEVPFPVPSLDPAAARFDAKRYWRGPTWAMMNMLIARGLADFGHPEAEVLRARTAALIARHGFAEYFDPLSGAPAGGGTFTWTAAIWLAWASPSAAKGDA